MTYFIRGRLDFLNLTTEDVAPENCSPVRLQDDEVAVCCMCLFEQDGNERAALRDCDVYLCNGWVLCGDHRYFVRTGEYPRRVKHPGYGNVDPCAYDDENLGRLPYPARYLHTEITGAAHYRALCNADYDQGD